MKVASFLVLLLTLLLVVACQPVMPVDDEASAQIEGTSWILAELDGEAVPSGINVTMMFQDDGTLGGSSGCNNYRTSYQVEGQSIEINPQIMSTMMMCPEPAMQVEMAYQQALATVTTFELSGDTLVLKDASGAPLLTFSAQSQDLAGTSWQVISYNNGKQAVVSVLADTELTANFDDTGMVSGSAGCNNYSGAFTTDGDRISIGPLAATMMLCVDEAINQQEMQYLQALESAASFRIEAGMLTMRTADDATAVNMKAAR